MLAFIDQDNIAQVWTGQPVNGVWHCSAIDQYWTDAQLNAAGIYRVQEFEVPTGLQIAGPPTYTLSGSVVVQSYPTAPLPPPPAPKAHGAGITTIAS